ncbi:TRAP transporter small permease subunit [Magnetovibrio sp. PR-2]|uniref:TRAP transporter small permease subunit n=1 Tax=Magnetovibrio sp. PR-2 TaxID=3120356 RepID=UPI002FCE5D79
MTTTVPHTAKSRFDFINPNLLRQILRFLGLLGAAVAIQFVINNFLNFWAGWPGLIKFINGSSSQVALGATQVVLNILPALAIAYWVFVRNPNELMRKDADRLTALTAYIIRSSFWAVVLVGMVDGTISFLRVEGLLPALFGTEMADQLGRSNFRGAYVHYPLVAVGFVIGLFTRTLGFTWLALFIVGAEILIVFTRFIFSYEQAYMGDLVRFWYAALFLFASAYTLIEEGHVRVDILFNTFSKRKQAWSNVLGTLLLGLPVCWVIMTLGMWREVNLINAPLLSYEVTQSGYGMYVKYLMAGFLMIYALSMIIQFCGFILDNLATLLEEPETHPHPDHDNTSEI